jgi:hypothetical protein
MDYISIHWSPIESVEVQFSIHRKLKTKACVFNRSNVLKFIESIVVFHEK